MPSLKQLTITGATWSFIGYGTSQLIRFGSNIILSRYLFPEAFGLSALVSTLLVGLAMFSDLGIGPSIIQHKRGDEPRFLNTAWTIGVIRGLVLWVCACVLAYPFSLFYGEPLLFPLIVVSGFTTLILGFQSTGVYTANKHLKIKVLTFIGIGNQIVSIIVMLIWVRFDPTVWALVAGSLAGSFAKTIASHVWLATVKHEFAWDKATLNDLFNFGRWIFFSTVLGFVVNNIDRLVIGKFLDLHFLGIFSIALMISKAMEEAFRSLNRRILFPVYAKIKDKSHEQIIRIVKKIRLALMGGFIPPMVLLIVLGPELIEFFYDERYHDAGWMLQILSLGRLVVICTEMGPFYLAFGDSVSLLKITAVRSLTLITLMIVGGYLGGGVGLVIGISLSQFLYYPTYIWVCRKYNLWLFKFDLIAISTSTFLILLGFWLKSSLLS